jgi:hypothetical protein
VYFVCFEYESIIKVELTQVSVLPNNEPSSSLEKHYHRLVESIILANQFISHLDVFIQSIIDQ